METRRLLFPKPGPPAFPRPGPSGREILHDCIANFSFRDIVSKGLAFAEKSEKPGGRKNSCFQIIFVLHSLCMEMACSLLYIEDEGRMGSRILWYRRIHSGPSLPPLKRRMRNRPGKGRSKAHSTS